MNLLYDSNLSPPWREIKTHINSFVVEIKYSIVCKVLLLYQVLISPPEEEKTKKQEKNNGIHTLTDLESFFKYSR